MSGNWNPRYAGESTFKKKNHYKQQEGAIIVARILPQPKGKNKDYSGVWSRYHSVVFGYKNSEGKFRPFESCLVKNKDTNAVEVPDPALDRINTFKDQLVKATVEKDQPLMAKLNKLIGQKGVYNTDNNHHMNVMLLDGSIGELKIRHKCKAALDEEIDKLRKSGIDPLSFENGRFFVFTRTGTSNETNFKVTVYTQEINSPEYGLVNKPVTSTVSPEVLARLETEGFNLDTLFVKPTPEEIAQIVAESDLMTGKSPACDRIFDARWKAERAAKTAANNAATQDDDMPAGYEEPKASFGTGKVLSGAPTNTTATVGTANASTTLASLNATLTVNTDAIKAAESVLPKTQAQAVDELSNEDFFKACGIEMGSQTGT